jgi:epoxyqueuosine reductase
MDRSSAARPSAADLSAAVVAKALACGADLAGVASVADLKSSPSHHFTEVMPPYDGLGLVEREGRKHGVVEWPEGARSAVAIAIAHPVGAPELDWWQGGGDHGNTRGNGLLIAVVRQLAGWLEAEHGARCWRVHYYPDSGGVYMKDAAVLAGLGCIGANNMVLTPEFGPRHRLRVLLTDLDLPSTGPSGFDPCDGCASPCRDACPQEAFRDEAVYSTEQTGTSHLPARDGVFDRDVCHLQMNADGDAAEQVDAGDGRGPQPLVKFCRACEMACIAGDA